MVQRRHDVRDLSRLRRRVVADPMSSSGVQLVVGKLITDEAFRQTFEARAHESLTKLAAYGIELTNREIAAFLETDPRLWSAMARQIDPRLRIDPLTRDSRTAGQATTPCALTLRERQVLRGVFGGRTNKQIGIDVGVSESAVKATVQQLFRKTRVRTRAQLVRAVIDGSLDRPCSL